MAVALTAAACSRTQVLLATNPNYVDQFRVDIIAPVI